MKLNIFVFLFGILLFTNCSSDDEPSLSSNNKITSFIIKNNDLSYSGKINHTSKVITLETVGLEQSNPIVPEIEISDMATIFPNPNIAQNFNESVEYIITAENGENAIYSINIINKPYSVEKDVLSFSFNVDGEIFLGKIDQDLKQIEVTIYKDVTSLSPEIEASDYATISPLPTEKLDFSNPVEYTITAEDGSTKIYTVVVNKQEINSTVKSCYIRATSFARVTFLDVSGGDFELFLENEVNSYKLNYFDLETWENQGKTTTNFYFTFNENILTASDYKLRFRLNGKIKAETPYVIDVLAENAPKIISASQTSYHYTDTLILYGENLVAGLLIPANGYFYVYDKRYVIVNEEQTKIVMELDVNRGMFPSWLGQPSPRPTRVNTYFNGRYGDSILLDFE